MNAYGNTVDSSRLPMSAESSSREYGSKAPLNPNEIKLQSRNGLKSGSREPQSNVYGVRGNRLCSITPTHIDGDVTYSVISLPETSRLMKPLSLLSPCWSP
jgi:hypothetical protein